MTSQNEGSQHGSDDASLLLSKLRTPRGIRKAIRRAGLEKQFLRALNQMSVTLLVAPPGFGKTTLALQSLKQWSHPYAWIQLGAEENDPAQFWAYVMRALGQIDAALNIMRKTNQTSQSLEQRIKLLCNQLSEVKSPCALVLDDYQVIMNEDVHGQLDMLVSCAPPTLRLVILSREECPLNLARLQATHRLERIGADALRFQHDEVRAFLHKTLSLPIADPLVEHMMIVTEGWPAALHLLALRWKHQPGDPGNLDALLINETQLTRYFDEELFNHMPPEVQAFLLKTSLLSELTPHLCAEVTGQANAQETLDYLARNQIFTMNLDAEGTHYRYHSLFAGYLQMRLQREQPQWINDVHNRAAACYLAQHDPTRAIEHLLRSGNFEQVIDHINRVANAMIMQGSHATLGRWLETIPTAAMSQNAQLCIVYAWVLFSRGRLDQAEHMLTTASTHISHPKRSAAASALLGEIAVLRSQVKHLNGDYPQAIEQAQQSLSLLPRQPSYLRGIALMILGYSQWLIGDNDQALENFQQPFAAAPNTETDVVRLIVECNQATLLIYLGQLHGASVALERVLELSQHKSGGYRMPTAIAHISLALILYSWNRLESALEHAQQGVELGQSWIYLNSLLPGYLILAQVQQARRRFRASDEALDTAERFIQIGQITPLQEMLEAHRARLRLQRGEIAFARRWAQRMTITGEMRIVPTNIGVMVAYAETMLAIGKPEAALPHLERVAAIAQSWYWGWMLIEIKLLQAIAYWHLGKVETALEMLRETLQAAEPEGHLRMFLDRGGVVETMLRRLFNPEESSPFLQEILRCFEDQSTHVSSVELGPQARLAVGPDSLTQREREVLALLGQGATNRQIAQQMVISEGTVKTHIKNILRKLNADNRLEAIAKVHQHAAMES